ncbi:hypothetical protein [Microbulbifer sp. TYP-18]|uniref:hypothetical protein n=1 Tax=Microbulbifer sp. TYP-18 TaxID=3230024 RepID=UPI0034C665FF
MHKIIAILAFSLLACASYANIIIEVPASPEQGFNFPYLLKLPDAWEPDKKTYLIVETNNTGEPSDNFSFHYAAAKGAIGGNAVGPWLARQLSFPILMPVFPRPETQDHIYTHALDRDTMTAGSSAIDRLDLQLAAMLEDAKIRLREKSAAVEDKILLTGFSASGTFANRFSFLHPEKIAMIVAGGLNGTLMLPIKCIDKHALNYPIGISDFESITGSNFDLDSWQNIAQFLFMGAQDTNDAVAYDDAYSEAERQTIYNTTGKLMQPDRWSNSQKVYLDSGANVEFYTFPGVGHATNGEIHREFLDFVKKKL